MRFFLEKRL